MLKRPLHTLLALTFALLQCAAPLVHAHVNGQHSGLLPPSLETQHHTQVLTDCVIEEDESAAITIPHEFQRDEQPVLPPTNATKDFDALPTGVVRLIKVSVAPPAVFSPYSKSHPQAPPALG
jgi:hypothetical protein